MANIFFDGFENLSNTYLNAKYVAVTGLPAPSWFSNTGNVARPGGSSNGPRAGNSPSGTHGHRDLGGNYAHVFVGMGVLSSAVGTFTGCIVALYDGATAQIGWKTASDGSISVYRGDNNASTLIGTSAAGAFVLGSVAADYHMVEMEVVFATGATGSVIVRVGDVVVLTVTSVQTANSANAYCNRIGISTKTTGSGVYNYDDLYLNDNSGSAPHNTFYGEAFVVESVKPSGDGNSSQWVGSDGNSVNNSLLVDEALTNDDTDYVASGTVGQKDLYASTNLANATGTIIGVEQNLVAKKDDVAVREIAGLLRTGATDYPQTTRTMTGSYVLAYERIDTNPNTSLPWAIADINGIEQGQEVVT